PSLGRWLSKDPLRFASGSMSTYLYVDNDPVNRLDPRGLFSLNAVGVGATIGGLSALAQGINNGVTGSDLLALAAGGVVGGALAGGIGAITLNESILLLGLTGAFAGPSGVTVGQILTNIL